MKHKKIFIISGVTALSMLVGGLIASLSMKHQMKNTDLSAHVGAHNVSSTDAAKEQTGVAKEAEVLKPQDNNASSSELQDIEFVQYTVKSNETLWRIANTYMPSYNAYPEDGKAGVIDYIVKENKLNKAADGKIVIYTGQKLTIPKQKEIALNNTKSTSVSKVKTESVEKTAQVSNTTSVSKSSNNTSNPDTTNVESTSNNSNNADKANSSTEDSTDQSDHTDHSSH